MDEQHTLPMVLTVKEVARLLRIGINKAYDLTRTPGFPSIRHGSRIIIPRDAFLRWLNDFPSRHANDIALR